MKDSDTMVGFIESDEGLREVLNETRTIAVIGMKGPGQGPAFSVPKYMAGHGYDIIPINPKLSRVLGVDALGDVSGLSGPVDMINIFRRSEYIPAHVDEILGMETLPGSVWLQLGIRHDESMRRLVEAGIKVVQDSCLLIEHRRLLR
ncbi:MAG: CoA-binding protein [Bradymonadaceae bacterium]